jgi:hypothetical protein
LRDRWRRETISSFLESLDRSRTSFAPHCRMRYDESEKLPNDVVDFFVNHDVCFQSPSE